VTSENVVKEELIHYDRRGKLKQYVVLVAADVINHVLIVAPCVLAEVGNS